MLGSEIPDGIHVCLTWVYNGKMFLIFINPWTDWIQNQHERTLDIASKQCLNDEWVFILTTSKLVIIKRNRIDDVMVSMLVSNAVDRGLKPEIIIDIWCFSSKHTVLRSKSKNWVDRNHDYVPESSEMATHRQLFQWVSL